VHVIPWKEFDPHSLRARLGFFSLKPRSIIDTFSSEMAGKITDLLRHQKYDLVIASQLQMAAYAPYFREVPAIFEELEIGLSYEDSRRALGWKKRLRHAFTWFKLRRYLARLLRSFRAVTVVSEQERELVRQNFPSARDILVMPNCINVEDYQDIRTEPKPNTLIFTGSFRYHTNYEAMLWFVGKVFPLVLQEVSTAQLIITGDHADLPLPAMHNIILAGYVDDIKSLIASSTVALAPLWSGGGTRLKILEAMALGTPVVATSKGAEGLDAQPGTHLFIADEPETFAEAVVQILCDKELRQRLALSGNELVRSRYEWGSVMPGFLQLAGRISGR
jgi:glycosyltransferase involved in cell wall biosynthesis